MFGDFLQSWTINQVLRFDHFTSDFASSSVYWITKYVAKKVIKSARVV